MTEAFRKEMQNDEEIITNGHKETTVMSAVTKRHQTATN